MYPSRRPGVGPRSASRSPPIYASSSSSSSSSSTASLGNRHNPRRQDLGRMHAGMEASGTLFSALGRGRDSNNGSVVSGGGGGGGGSRGDEEGLGLLRQQLSAVQRIRMEHERKDATIAALRLEVADASRDREKARDLEHELNGARSRMAGMEERCRQLESEERDASSRWARKEDIWGAQLRDADQRLTASQKQCRAERDRAEQLGAVRKDLEPALRSALAEATAANEAAKREETARIDAELRARTVTESLTLELEAERSGRRGMEDRVRLLNKELDVAHAESAGLSVAAATAEKANEGFRAEFCAARSRYREAELALAQLQVYRPLVERADAIDRQRVEAEEGLVAARAELERGRASLAAALKNAAELQAALDRKEKRLTQAEAEASRALALERDLLSTRCRLDAAQAEKMDATRALQAAEISASALAAALDELAELTDEAISPSSPPLQGSVASTSPRTHRSTIATAVGDEAPMGMKGQTGARDEVCVVSTTEVAGGENRQGAIARLSNLEAALRKKGGVHLMNGNASANSGDVSGNNGGALRGGGGRGSGWSLSLGEGELRRAVRAVRVLAESRATIAAEHDRLAHKLCDAVEQLQLLRSMTETLRQHEARLTDEANKAKAAHAALLSKLRNAQLSKETAEASANTANLKLDDVHDFLASLAGAFARRLPDRDEVGLSDPVGSRGSRMRAPGKTGSREATREEEISVSAAAGGGKRLIAAVAAGVQELVEGRAAAVNACHELESRCSRGRREVDDLTSLAREREVAHRGQLEELRGWCEAEVDKQRKGKKAAQTAADQALENLAVALRRISVFEKDKTRLTEHLTTVNRHLSSLKEESVAAKAGLRLLARACAPLLERCQSLATQRRLVSRWYREQPNGLAHLGYNGSNVHPDESLLVEGLRSFAAALGREGCADACTETVRGRPAACSSWLDGSDVATEGRENRGTHLIGGDNAGDARGRLLGHGVPRGTMAGRADDECRRCGSLVSLRAVGIALVAAQRLKRIASIRAAARAAEAALSIALESAAKLGDGCTKPRGGGETQAKISCYEDRSSHAQRRAEEGQPSSPRQIARLTSSGDVIPLGWRSQGGGAGVSCGVAMLSEADVPSVSLHTLALESSRNTASSGATSGDSAARFLRLLSDLLSSHNAEVDKVESPIARNTGGGAFSGGNAPTLLQALAKGQVGHWRRLEDRGLVNLPVRLRSSTTGGGGGGSGVSGERAPGWNGGGLSRLDRNGDDIINRVVASRYARHRGGTLQQRQASKRKQGEEEALRLLEATRRGTAALARCAGEAETRLVDSEARRLRIGRELEAALDSEKSLRAQSNEKAELASFLAERVQMLETEAAGTVPAAALAGTEKALAEIMSEVETLRVRSAALETQVAVASSRRKKDARRARRGAETACKEQAIRAQLQDELLSLRSYVLRSEEAVQELQEVARRQAREESRRRREIGGGGRQTDTT